MKLLGMKIYEIIRYEIIRLRFFLTLWSRPSTTFWLACPPFPNPLLPPRLPRYPKFPPIEPSPPIWLNKSWRSDTLICVRSKTPVLWAADRCCSSRTRFGRTRWPFKGFFHHQIYHHKKNCVRRWRFFCISFKCSQLLYYAEIYP